MSRPHLSSRAPLRVGDEGRVDLVGEVSFQGAAGFAAGRALGDLAVVEVAPGAGVAHPPRCFFIIPPSFRPQCFLTRGAQTGGGQGWLTTAGAQTGAQFAFL